MTAAPTVAALDGADPLAHALTYAALGWRVVPILPGQKRPSLDRWTERATTDPELIGQWWGANPDHGVGIATGPQTGWFALDVDPAHGGADTLADLEASYYRLPDTVEAITGGGGRHLLFRWPESMTAGQRLGNSAGRLGPGLDIRGDGGQIVVAPTLHPTSGRRYQWELSSRPGEVDIAEAPGWLLALLLEDHTPLPEGQLATRLYDQRFAWDSLNAAGNEAAVAMLEAAGWKRSNRHPDADGTIYLTRPGKGVSEGTSASVGKIHPGVTMVFTSEAPPLEAERAYNPAELYAALHHGGDREAADAALVAQSGLAPTYAVDHAAIAAWVAGEHARAVALGLANGEGNGIGNGIGEVREAHAFLAEPEEPYDWLVEGLIERGDRLILTGPEGGGKSTLLRQMAVQIAAGIHPFGEDECPRANVLIVDCENSPRHIKRKLRGLVELAGPKLERDHLWIVPKPEGIDLGSARDLEWLLAIADEVRPQLLIIGPIYKMSDGDPIEEQTAKVVIRAIDTIRARHDCAVLIEAHTPHEGKTERPYGASIWKRWPEFGLYLDPASGALRHWRGARDERAWPHTLGRGKGRTAWPWEPAHGNAATFAAMVDIQRAAARAMSVRELADALTAQGLGRDGAPVSKSTVARAIEANREQWQKLLEDRGLEPVKAGRPPSNGRRPWDS